MWYSSCASPFSIIQATLQLDILIKFLTVCIRQQYKFALTSFSPGTTRRMNLTPEPCFNCNLETSLNSSRDVETTQDTISVFRPLLSVKDFYVSVLILSCVLIVSSCIGLPSNVLVLVAYYKIGFVDSINISYFALGVSDIGVIGTTVWGAILNFFDILEVDLPFHALELSSPTMYWPGEGFEKTTSCITAYIALERCLCVLFPLHVKRFVTRGKSTVVVTLIFILVFVPSNLSFLFHTFAWRFDPAKNRTVLRVDAASHYYLQILREATAVYISSLVHFTALIFICTCSIFLTVALKQNEKSRETILGRVTANTNQTRNNRVVKTVLLISGAYLAFSTPRVMVNILQIIYPETFSVRGRNSRIYLMSIIVGVQLSLCNSSVNVFIYIYMSSKFRETIKQTLCS